MAATLLHRQLYSSSLKCPRNTSHVFIKNWCGDFISEEKKNTNAAAYFLDVEGQLRQGHRRNPYGRMNARHHALSSQLWRWTGANFSGNGHWNNIFAGLYEHALPPSPACFYENSRVYLLGSAVQWWPIISVYLSVGLHVYVFIFHWWIKYLQTPPSSYRAKSLVADTYWRYCGNSRRPGRGYRWCKRRTTSKCRLTTSDTAFSIWTNV